MNQFVRREPAFPVSPDLGLGLTSRQMRGITVHDYFAAKAMQALIIAAGKSEPDISLEDLVDKAYAYADNMVEAKKYNDEC